MLSAQKNKLSFTKMNAAQNDFIIFDARTRQINLSQLEIVQISQRKNIGCDQLIIIKNSDKADCLMEIYNQDGSRAGACGNATRCVAGLLMEEKNLESLKIETAAGVLDCWFVDILAAKKQISVAMTTPKFSPNFIFAERGIEFFCVDMGNPHAVVFVDLIPSDADFFSIGPKVENHKFFPNKTNVEFAKIISPEIIEVRVFERGAGETLACGSGACAVAAAAIKNKLTAGKKIITRFKGGDITIEWPDDSAPIIMTGDYNKIFIGEVFV